MTQQCLDQVGNLWKWLGVDCLLTCLPPEICWAWQMCRAAQREEPTPSWAGRPQLCISTSFVSGAEWGMVALAPLEWQVTSCKEADCAGKCILGPSLCLCCRDFGGFGLNTPTNSHSHLVRSWSAFGQSNPVCTAETTLPWKQIWVSGDNSKIFFKSSFPAEPAHCHPHPSMAGGSNKISERRTESCAKKYFLPSVFLLCPLVGSWKYCQPPHWCLLGDSKCRPADKRFAFPLHLLQTLQKTFLAQTPPAKNNQFQSFGPDLWAAELCSVWWQ